MDGSTLADIEEIRRLKARYCRLMDEKRWPEWGQLFVEDATLTSRHADGVLSRRGRDAIAADLEAGLASVETLHQATIPEIAVTGPESATGTWAAAFAQAGRFHGYGRYDDVYVKRDGRWLIEAVVLTTLWTEKAGERISPGAFMRVGGTPAAGALP